MSHSTCKHTISRHSISNSARQICIFPTRQYHHIHNYLVDNLPTRTISSSAYSFQIPKLTISKNIRRKKYAKKEPGCSLTLFMCILFLTLKAPIATKVVCFSRQLKCLRSLCGKQCGPRSD